MYNFKKIQNITYTEKSKFLLYSEYTNLYQIINCHIYFSHIRQFCNFYLRKELRTLIINLWLV